MQGSPCSAAGIRLGRVLLTPDFLLLCALTLWLGDSPALCACLLAAAVHELSHVAACLLLGLRIRQLTFTLFGLRLTLWEEAGGWRLFWVAAAGPVVNLLLCGVLLALRIEYLFSGANLLLGLFNLMPVLPLDGGRMVQGVLSELLTPELATQAEDCISFWGLLVLGLAAAVLAVLGNPSLLAVVGWMLLSEKRRK